MQELSVHAQAYALARGLAANSTYQVLHSVEMFGRWLGRPAVLSDLTDHRVSQWLADLEKDHALRSVRGHRANLLCVWRWLGSTGLVEGPRFVRRVRPHAPLPRAWTLAELDALIIACVALPHGDYFEALILAAYDTGLRRSDLFRLERDWIRPDGVVAIVQNKTRQVIYPQMREYTLERVLALPGVRPLVWHGDLRRFYRCFAALRQAAGVRHGALQQLRRTGATWLAEERPGEVQRYLGHSSPQMQRHYVDWSLLTKPRPQPPDVRGHRATG